MATKAQDIADEAWRMSQDGVMPAAPALFEEDKLDRFAYKNHEGESQSGLIDRHKGFVGTLAPQRELQSERPIHRLAACLCAAGLSFREVAKRLDVHPSSVSNWYRQPWFQEFMAEEVRITGVEPLKALLQGAARDSVVTLIELRDDRNVPASVRKAAASDLLDRAYGKAPTVVKHESNSMDATKDMASLDREIKEILSGGEFIAEGA